MKYFAMIALISVVTLTMFSSSLAQIQPAKDGGDDKAQSLMRRKLTHAQAILDGLANEDYVKIAKNSQQISLMSMASSWQVLQTPEYVDHTADFRGSANRITAAALDKNIDGATLGYVEMTMKCVSCHKHLRTVTKP